MPFAVIPFMDQAPGRKPNTTLYCFTITTVAPAALNVSRRAAHSG
jgi:hypothetical protein